MNTFQLNLNIATELMNNDDNGASPVTFRKILNGISEVGNYLKTERLNKREIGNEWINETYSLEYENCTLKVDYIAQNPSKSRILKGYTIK